MYFMVALKLELRDYSNLEYSGFTSDKNVQNGKYPQTTQRCAVVFDRVLCQHGPFVRSLDGNSRQSTEENAYIVTLYTNHSIKTFKNVVT